MTRTIELRTTVLAGSRIEVSVPELPVGQPATVRITVDEAVATRSWRENLGSYTGGRLFSSAAEVEAYLEEERNSWE